MSAYLLYFCDLNYSWNGGHYTTCHIGYAGTAPVHSSSSQNKIWVGSFIGTSILYYPSPGHLQMKGRLGINITWRTKKVKF